MLGYIYNYFFGEIKDDKIDNSDLLILKKSININNMNKLDNETYRIEQNIIFKNFHKLLVILQKNF